MGNADSAHASSSSSATKSSDGPDETKRWKPLEDAFKEKLRFGRNAVGRLEQPKVGLSTTDLFAKVPEIILASVPKANSVKGERGAKTAPQMIQAAYRNGLFTLGDARSPVNCQIRPALVHIFGTVSKLRPKDPHRVAPLKAMVDACVDCQQVQAREILRIFGEMTNQNATFEGQILYFLAKQKEEALYRLITEMHPTCDKSYREVGSGGQRAHLKSAYLHLLGEEFGIQGINAARADRFLAEAQKHVKLTRPQIVGRLTAYCCPERLVKELLFDINNQSDKAERLISPKCVFDWVKKNMSEKQAYRVFYDEDRAEEYKDLEVKKPTDDNQYNPFLSPVFLVEILMHMKMIRDPSKKEVIDLTTIDMDIDDGVAGGGGGGGDSRRRRSRRRSKADDGKPHKWQVNLGSSWTDFQDLHSVIFESAYYGRRSAPSVPFTIGKWSYVLDMNRMVQINVQTQKTRRVRRVPRS